VYYKTRRRRGDTKKQKPKTPYQPGDTVPASNIKGCLEGYTLPAMLCDDRRTYRLLKRKKRYPGERTSPKET
jgi:hypothetical protein